MGRNWRPNFATFVVYLFIYTLFNVDNLELLLWKDKIVIHNILYANLCQLQ